MITVAAAAAIVQQEWRNYGSETVPFLQALGRTLAQALVADRDLPPFHRVSMDGIAIRFEDYAGGSRQFRISGVVGAGEPGPNALEPGCCVEIMTGAALPAVTDTVIQYEHLEIHDGVASMVREPVKKGQHIHARGIDQLKGTVLVPAGRRLTALELSVAASIGADTLEVRKNPRVAVFSSGNELVDVHETPENFQIRRSNVYAIDAFLQLYGIHAERIHLPDDKELIRSALTQAIHNFDVLLLSGGVSAGKFDYLPEVLQQIGVNRLFHKVQQRPGKPFWFGTFGAQGVVFAFPGNPVSTWFCLIRYFQPWLEACFGSPSAAPRYAKLTKEVIFEPALTMFMPVKLAQDSDGTWLATPVEYHGSGDYAALLKADGFFELALENSQFPAGVISRVWPFPR